MTDDRPDFGVLLALAQVTFAEELRSYMAEVGFAGFSTRLGAVLRVLQDRPLGLRALADELGMTSQATLKIVDRMTQLGLVDRTPSRTDGRVRLVAMSDHGRAALEVARGFHDRFESELADGIGAASAADTRRALEHVASRAPAIVPRAVRPH